MSSAGTPLGGEKISVIIVDDHAIVRQGLRTYLELQPDLEVLGEASNGNEAVALVRETLPDIVLMDLVMPQSDGVEATRSITGISPSTRVIVLTSFSEDEKVFASIKAGAQGYLDEGCASERAWFGLSGQSIGGRPSSTRKLLAS